MQTTPHATIKQPQKELVKSRRLERLKARLVNHIQNKTARAAVLGAGRKTNTLRGHSKLTLAPSLATTSDSIRAITQPTCDRRLQWLETEITRQLSVRAYLTPTGLRLECGTKDALSNLLEQLGVQL